MTLGWFRIEVVEGLGVMVRMGWDNMVVVGESRQWSGRILMTAKKTLSS